MDGTIEPEALPAPDAYEDIDDEPIAATNGKPRKRGRPPARFQLEKHQDGHYVTDAEGEVDDAGPFASKRPPKRDARN